MTDRSKVRSRFEAQPPMEKSIFKVNSRKMTFPLQTGNTPKLQLATSFRTHGPGKAARSSQHRYSSSLLHKMSSWATPKAANFKTGRLWCPDTQQNIPDTQKYGESCVRPSHWTQAESKRGYSRLGVLNRSCFSSLCSETYISFSLKLPFSFEEQSTQK